VNEHEVKIGAPLWALGPAALAVGLLTGRKLLILGGAASIIADRNAEPVQRALALFR
jgi:hypothetical protein